MTKKTMLLEEFVSGIISSLAPLSAHCSDYTIYVKYDAFRRQNFLAYAILNFYSAIVYA